jgi:GDP-4-dehydro-6-deoxy-D-mannose reductase
MKVLITGVAGFAGSHLAEFIVKKGHERFTFGGEEIEVHGVDRQHTRRDNIRRVEPLIVYHEADLTDFVATLSLIRKTAPDRIFHLAAQSFVPTSWGAPADTLRTNIMAELNIFEACRELGISPRIQIACSSEEYGLVAPEECPIKESNPLRPMSPYAVSKVAQDMLGFQYYQSYGLYVVRTRAFNHTGPRRGEQFATSNFAKQIAEIEAGLHDPVMQVGNMEARRDFTDVRDMVEAYWLALEKAKPGVYNVCTGNCWSISEVLLMLVSMSPKNGEISAVPDPERMRPSDVPILQGDCSMFKAETGWQPKVPLKKTLQDLLGYWREKIGSAYVIS